MSAKGEGSSLCLWEGIGKAQPGGGGGGGGETHKGSSTASCISLLCELCSSMTMEMTVRGGREGIRGGGDGDGAG